MSIASTVLASLGSILLPEPRWFDWVIAYGGANLLGSLLIGIGILVCDAVLRSRWVPAVRARMATRKWPALIVAFMPCLLFPMWRSVEKLLPSIVGAMIASEWTYFAGWTCCIAVAACWLKLPQHCDRNEEPRRRNLISEWLLGLALLNVNYSATVLMPLSMRPF